MTTTTQVPAVIDYLVAAATSSPLLGESATAPVVVIDGPSVTADTQAQQRHLWIGWDEETGSGPGAEAVQAWPVMDNARTRDEDGDIIMTAEAWTGSTVMKEARDACDAIVGAVELLLRGTPATGGPGDASMGGLVMWSAVDGPYQWIPRQGSSGAGYRCVFRVTYRARLVTS